MKNLFLRLFIIVVLSISSELVPAQLIKNRLVFHEIQTDKNGKIMHWYINVLGINSLKKLD